MPTWKQVAFTEILTAIEMHTIELEHGLLLSVWGNNGKWSASAIGRYVGPAVATKEEAMQACINYAAKFFDKCLMDIGKGSAQVRFVRDVSTETKLCPFCQSLDAARSLMTHEMAIDIHYVKCEGCAACGPTSAVWADEVSAIAAWNGEV